MCNIAGYIGKKNAAPILAEMMKKQEGFGGGYYTGIATIDGGKLYSTKVVGDMKNLLAETDSINFPGTTGFIHSRSKSGGDVEWGHPFVSCKGNMAYVANGALGVFHTKENSAKKCEVAAMLEKKGYTFPSRVKGVIGDYPALPDGTAIHDSDLMCQYISYLIESGKAPDEAMSQAMSELPSEAVGLILRDDIPGKIYVSRINYPMMIGISDDGDTYLATTAIAFPDDVNFRVIEALPPASTFEVFMGGYRLSEHPLSVLPVASITPDIWYRAYEIIEKFLKGREAEPLEIGYAMDECNKLWPEGKVNQSAPLGYEVVRALKNQGKLHIKYIPSEGAFDGYMTNRFHLYVK